MSAKRLRIALVLMLMLLSLLAARLFQLQGIDPQAYAARAQVEGLVHVTLPASRGDIVDRSGNPLAQSAAGDMIVADPTMTVTNAGSLAKLLTSKLGLDYFNTLQALTTDKTSAGTPLRFAYIARRIPADKASAVVKTANANNWPGLFLNADPIRYYPGDDVAANLIGFMNGQGKPAAGLEQSFNAQLSGRDGSETYEAGDGARIPLGENTQIAPVNGQTLKLTIDRDAQWTAQRLLREAVISNGGASGVAIAMDVHSGQILALADYPSFDANKPQDSSSDNWGSRAVAAPYEPGSVEKVLTSSALIQEGLVTPATQVVVPSVLTVLGHAIHDFEVHGTEHLTLAGVIAKSSNIGMALAATRIPATTLGRFLNGFGLGRLADIGLPGESQGQLPNPSGWNQLTHANIAFGQGLSVTALQMAAAVNTVANGGEYIAPSLILGQATDASGNKVGSDLSTSRRVVSAETAGKVARMMEQVTRQGVGTAPNAMIPGYRVAGKTGTAQEVGARCGCYDHTAVSFAGFAPADNPRFTVYVVVERPRAGSTGFSTAAPVFRSLMGYLLQKYAVPPTGAAPAQLKITW
jgi:cell division protein FtsI (penicillin-binding protein 3)